MLLSQDFKDFAAFICPVITMIGVIVTLIVTIQINKEVLMGVNDMSHHGGCKAASMPK
jgi:hypothetical protein